MARRKKKRDKRDGAAVSANNHASKKVNETGCTEPVQVPEWEDPPARKEDDEDPGVSGKRRRIELPPGKKYLSSEDGISYQNALETVYSGFSLLHADEMPRTFHTRSRDVLEALRDAEYYQYDIVMAGGKHLSRTFVQRTLVGEPGLTYKYLGLRLFCHAWSGAGVQPIFRAIHGLNQELIRLTKEAQMRRRDKDHGSCEYNLTLINYMPSSSSANLREEPMYGMGKTSVSWHADSSLQDMSCIAVYHTVPGTHSCDWRIALRRNPEDNKDNSTPPLVVSTKSGDTYFLLDEFNHQFQHTVLAGSASHRISSTHRVAVETTDTYEYIRSKVSEALVSSKKEMRGKKGIEEWNVSIIVAAQVALTEVEFEWIAQYWVQGNRFNEQHVWWQGPMKALEKAWDSLEKVTFEVYEKLMLSSTSNANKRTENHLEIGKVFIEALKTRHEMRQKWNQRRAEKIYQRRVPKEYRPVDRPIFSKKNNRLPRDLSAPIQSLESIYGC